ncbi:prolyl oligopeptidase family serine peptidase [Streptomyces sp. NPDC006368]|uniref:prolyl oligopeptidase family serine peptidase n=1 Tax=Streptomyces sp. NPDC006368 TaxID=3156760 RepID=UPI0033AE0D51
MTRRMPVVEDVHGRRVEDPYRWLEADDGVACEEWLAEQRAWFEAQAAGWGTRPVFRRLLEEFTEAGTATAPAASPPVWRGPYRFSLRRDAGRELPVLVVDSPGHRRRVLVDPLVPDRSGRTVLDAWRPSWSGRFLVFQVSSRGSEEPALRVMDVVARRPIGPVLHPGRVSSVAWLADDSGFYYVGTGDDGARQVRLHPLDAAHDGGADTVVFETRALQLSVSTSADGRRLAISEAPGAQRGNRVHLADLTTATARAPRLGVVHDGTATGAQALVRFGPRALLYAITTDGAPGGRVCRIDPGDTPGDGPGDLAAAAWTPLITAGEGTVISACVALTEPGTGAVRFLLSSSRDGAACLSLHDADGGLITDVETPGTGPGTLTRLTVPPGGTDQAWFTYTDFLTAPAVHRFSLRDRRCHPDGPGPPPAPAPSGPARQAPAEVRRVTYPSEDGTAVPLFLVMPTDRGPGPRPTLLTAYGGFGARAAPAYSATIRAWVAAGGIYAIAGVRGGGEHGTTWHRAGSGVNKPTALADHAAAARWLIGSGLTDPGRLAVKGASHSGLMVAAAITRDPHLYAAAVCSGSLTDLVRYPRLGMGRWWIDEFGDPDDPAHLDVLLGYSPYHRVRPATRYPAVLMATARTDPRVGAAHTRKFTAALQHATTGGRPVVLRCEDGVGHGARAVSRWLDMEADALAFCAAHTGLRLTAPPAGP